MNYFVGQQAAIKLAPKVEIGIVGVAMSLSALGIFSKSAIIRQQASEDNFNQLPHQVMVEDTGEVVEVRHDLIA